MHQFGGFNITDTMEMKFFGQMIQAFLVGPGQAITPSATKELSAKDLPVRPPARPYKPPEDPFQNA